MRAINLQRQRSRRHTWDHQAEEAAGQQLAVVPLDLFPAAYEDPMPAPPVLLPRLCRQAASAACHHSSCSMGRHS